MKKVSFTEMKNGTKEDYLFLDRHEKNFASKTADRILKFISGLTETLEGYQVSRLEHSLQCATRAYKNNESIIKINIRSNKMSKPTKDDANLFIENNGNPYDFTGEDKSGYFGIDMGITGVPETFIIDENGIIILRHIGPIDFSNEILNR